MSSPVKLPSSATGLRACPSGKKSTVRKLGANEVIDYNAVHFEDTLRDIDVVFDAVGGEALHRSWRVLNQNRRL